MALASNNPSLTSWVAVPEGSDFPIQNLPFGIFSTKARDKRVGVAIGNQIIDLFELAKLGYLKNEIKDENTFHNNTLNGFMASGKEGTRAVRERLSVLLSSDSQELQGNEDHVSLVLIDQDEAQMHMPVKVGDYTDFYSSKEHATNVGTMFRDPDNALLPNWLHIPVGYHGRASSIVPSGTAIKRPKGQQKPDDGNPVFGPCKLLDFEVEMAFVTYNGKPMGDTIDVNEAEDFIFGMCLFNDWSARDIQKWEYVPLGPFLAKNFASSISPWIVTMDALEPYRVESPKQDPTPLPYLQTDGNKSFDIAIQAYIKPENGEENLVCNTNYKYMYWSMAQQLAHHTVNGCNINAGDMMASGTISGPDRNSFGSMLEISWKGTKPLTLSDGSERKFIQDNDTVIMRGYCDNGQKRIGFGEVSTFVNPAD